MESRIITIITVLALNIGVSFANANISMAGIRPAENTMLNLAPVTPVGADFNDLVPEASASYTILVPVAPKEATFEDDSITDVVSNKSLLKYLSPVTPKEAGFEENS